MPKYVKRINIILVQYLSLKMKLALKSSHFLKLCQTRRQCSGIRRFFISYQTLRSPLCVGFVIHRVKNHSLFPRLQKNHSLFRRLEHLSILASKITLFLGASCHSGVLFVEPVIETAHVVETAIDVPRTGLLTTGTSK